MEFLSSVTSCDIPLPFSTACHSLLPQWLDMEYNYIFLGLAVE